MVACNAASSAALEALERHLAASGAEVDVIGVVAPATQLAVAGSRNGRIGLLATPATVASGAYERAVAAADRHVHAGGVAVPGPGADHPGRRSRSTSRSSRRCARYCAPLRAAEVDTVILGCTHYPLVAPMLQRMLGRGVTLVTSGAGRRAQRRAGAGRARAAEPARSGEGAYRFRCTGDVDAFERLGTRFLQMPLGEVVGTSSSAPARAAA